MWSFSFSLFELWYLPVILSFVFFLQLIKSFFVLGDYFSANPLFEKRKLKNFTQISVFSSKLSFIFVFTILFLFFQNSNQQENKNLYVLLVYVVLFLFYKVIVRTNNDFKLPQNQTINTSSLFLFGFIPSTTAVINSTNLIDFLIPLEILGLLLYFVLLEFSYTHQTSTKSKRLKLITVIRSYLYYYWLNFVGTASFIIAILISSTSQPTTEFIYLETFKLNNELSTNLIFFFIFLGLFTKMGGLFFFLFKTDLYKVLSINGVFVFSVFSSIFYMLVFFFFCLHNPTALLIFKYCVSFVIVLITFFLFFLNSLEQKNVYTFAGLSTVLTLTLCVLIVI